MMTSIQGTGVRRGKRDVHQEGSHRLLKSIESLSHIASGSTAQNGDGSVSCEGHRMKGDARRERDGPKSRTGVEEQHLSTSIVQRKTLQCGELRMTGDRIDWRAMPCESTLPGETR